MSCVNTRYTPDELESIFLWDLLCENIPITREERKEIRERDAKSTGKPTKTEEQRERDREYARRWRAAHKEHIKAYNASHRDEINERQREYDKTKRTKAGVS